MGWPLVGSTFTSNFASCNFAASHWAQRWRSWACSGLVLTLGMRRKSFKPARDSAWRESICFKTRSTVAFIMNRSLSEAKDFGRLSGGRFINQSGDESVVPVVRKRQIFSFGGGNHIARLIGHQSVGLNHSSPRGVY